jgi:hypothetical protein
MGATTEHGATLQGGFSWTRAGTEVVVTISNLEVLDSSGQVVAAAAVQGVGNGSFVPTNGPGWCLSTQYGQTALIAGVAMSLV